MQISDDEDKTNISRLVESVESGVIPSSSSEWKIGSEELFVTCFNCDSEYKIKLINNYLNLFINTSLNHISIRSGHVKHPENKLISNSEQLFNATDILPITFSVILPPNPRNLNSIYSQINPETSDENKNSEVCTIKILLDSGASASIVYKDLLYERHKILKDKKDKCSTFLIQLS